MPIVNAREMMLEAARGGYAVGAFSVTSLIQMEGVIDAAAEKRSPVILQTSTRSAEFLGADVLAAVFRTIAAAAPVPLCLHLNHCTDAQYARSCAETGYTSVMLDGSRLQYAENLLQTCQAVQECHEMGNISVEGALGTIADVQAVEAGREGELTDPRQAAEFVEATGVDLFAPAVGTAHGVYRSRYPAIDFDRLQQINATLNGNGHKTPLVIHGGTGLPAEHIRRLQQAGGLKFNISTALIRTLIDAQYDYLAANRDEYEPWKVDVAVRDATRKVVGQWMEMLGSVGKA